MSHREIVTCDRCGKNSEPIPIGTATSAWCEIRKGATTRSDLCEECSDKLEMFFFLRPVIHGQGVPINENG